MNPDRPLTPDELRALGDWHERQVPEINAQRKRDGLRAWSEDPNSLNAAVFERSLREKLGL